MDFFAVDFFAVDFLGVDFFAVDGLAGRAAGAGPAAGWRRARILPPMAATVAPAAMARDGAFSPTF